jgi:tetratricopeptide (TPR) repeat protein
VAGERVNRRPAHHTPWSIGALLVATPPPLTAQDVAAAEAQSSPPEAESAEQSISRIQELLAQEPDNATGHLSLGTLFFQQGRFDAARDHLQRAVELAPSSVEAHATLAVVLEQLNDLEAAEKEYSAALEILPDNPDIRVRRAALRNRLDNQEGALEDLEQALQSNPGIIQAIFGKGILLQSMGHTQEAIATMRTVEQQTSEPQARAQAHMQIGQWLGAEGQTDEAMEELRLALEIQPDLRAAQLVLANLAADSGRYVEAAKQFAEVVSAAPDNQSARFGLAVALLMTEQYPAALATAEESISRFPDWLAMKHMLARLLATSPDDTVRDGERALQLATEVMQSQPGLQSAQTLAMAYAEIGRFEEAIALQRDLIQRFELAGSDDRLQIFQHRLELYEQGQPVRAPWLEAKHGGGF